MLDENQENGSPQLQRFPEELWLINAPFSIFAWLTSLKLVAKYDWEQSLTEGDILNLLSVVNRLQLLACYQNHEDFKPLALLSIFVEQVKNKQASSVKNIPNHPQYIFTISCFFFLFLFSSFFSTFILLSSLSFFLFFFFHRFLFFFFSSFIAFFIPHFSSSYCTFFLFSLLILDNNRKHLCLRMVSH